MGGELGRGGGGGVGRGGGKEEGREGWGGGGERSGEEGGVGRREEWGGARSRGEGGKRGRVGPTMLSPNRIPTLVYIKPPVLLALIIFTARAPSSSCAAGLIVLQCACASGCRP